ncbi:hypothetical protein [Rhodococcus sp. 077-4]|uniref:hypothetical protein n=1 Tax=Rhodococcus sp. 077-4 TaxID=2789271 RepID=UPI0039F4EE76
MKLTGTRSSAWSTVAVILGTVTAGTIAAGLLHNPQPEPVVIPGCAEVVQPEDMHRVNFAFVVAGDVDKSEVPWRFEAKARAMTDALIAALPTGAVVEPDPLAPAFGFDAVAVRQSLSGDAEAFGTITVGNRTGILTVTVGLSDQPAGPCFAGVVDERSTQADGTVVDTTNGTDTHRASASAPDGTRIDVNARGVLTHEQVVDIALAPGLRASAPA